MVISPAIFDAGAAVILLVVALLGACAPLILIRYGQKREGFTGRNLAFILGNMLSAGVMVSAGFVHLLGQAIVELPVRDDTVFPWAPFLCGVGFLSTLLADQYAESLSEKASGSATPGFAQMRSCHSRDNSFLGSGPSLILDHEGAFLQQVAVAGAWNATEDPEAAQSAPADSDENIAGKQPATAPSKPAQQTRGSPGVTKSVELNSLRQIPHVGVTATPAHGSPRLEGQRAPVRREETDLSDEQLEETLLPSTAGEGRETSDSLAFGNGDVQKDAQDDEHLHHHHSKSWPDRRPQDRSPREEQTPSYRSHRARHRDTAVSFATAVLMAVALCFHSILEGAAMGAQSNVVDILHIFIAIAAHKGLAAYALGSSLVDSKAEGPRFWTVIGAFALATPLGILLGTLLASFASGRAAAGLSALASGTFLYVSFMEVIPRELGDHDYRLHKLSMLIMGFGSMSVLAIWA